MTPTPPQEQFTDALQAAQFATAESILQKETGLKLARKIYQSQTAEDGGLNFFKKRSDFWRELKKWATGTQSNKEFLQYFSVSDGNKALFPMDMSPTMVGAWLVNTLVTDMSKNEEYPCVSAVDDGSVTEKEQRKLDALFRMRHAQAINQLEEHAGMMLEAPNAYTPENELAAEIYFKLQDRLPKEIRYEQLMETALGRNQYANVLSPKLYFDLIVCNFGATKIESDGRGGYVVRKCTPENVVYNYVQGDSARDELTYIGEVYSLKIKDIRRKFPKTTEKELFELARTATQHSVGQHFNFSWNQQFQLYTADRPWDDFSIPVFDFEIQVSLSDYFTKRTDNAGKENFAPKNSKPKPTSAKSEVKTREKKRWYRGVYAPFAQTMLYWGLPDLVLFPFLNIEDGLSSYTVNIPFNQGEYVPSLFQRAMEPLKEYTLTKLKRKQLISNLRPKGIRIDIESARNIDLGNGDTIPWEEVLRIYNQTGNELYSSRGVRPNEREAPAISATAPDDSIQQIIHLTEVANSHLQEIRTLIGLPLYRDGGDVGDRTANALAERQASASYNVTDFIPSAKQELMSETLYKCCLLEWQKAVREGDTEIMNTEFEVVVKMKPTLYEKQILSQRIEVWSKTPDKWGNPLLSPKDVFFIENIRDFKLAALYMSDVVERNRKQAMEESERLQAQNAQVQQESARQAAEQQMQIDQQKQQMDAAKIEAEGRSKKQEILLSGFMELLKAGFPIPAELMPLFNATMQNIAVPLVAETQEMQQHIQEKMQAEQQQAQAQQAQAQQVQQVADANGVSPEEVMAQMSQQGQEQPQ